MQLPLPPAPVPPAEPELLGLLELPDGSPTVADGAGADADLPDLGPLGPLERDWLSRRFGAVCARRRRENPARALDSPCLLIFRTGQGTETTPAVGMLYTCMDEKYCRGIHKGTNVVLEIFDSPKKYYWLDKQSTAKRVLWENSRSQEADIWDGSLLDSIRKAAEWVEGQHKLDAKLDLGLSRFSTPAQTSKEAYGGLTVALCVSTMNRLWQLRRALPLNILHCWPHRSWTKIHVVDFGSADGTLDFLLNRCRAAIDCGLLCVYSADEMKYWHASTAKNTVHACASQDILVNVDGDNLVGPEFLVHVAKSFQEGYTALHYEDGEGTCGRIACLRTDFVRIRGYDEDAYPMGAQDVDLLERLKALPDAKFRKVRGFSQAIPNTRDMKVACCSPSYGGLKWGRMDTLNRVIFQWRQKAGQIARNPGRENIGVKAWRIFN